LGGLALPAAAKRARAQALSFNLDSPSVNRPFDGVTLLGVGAVVALVSLAAAGIPAWRGTLIDPQVSPHNE